MPSPVYKREAKDFNENPQQLQAYESEGNCAVLAGPGSGKTKVLTVKVAKMLAGDLHEPHGLACITYSNECRIELMKRLARLGVDSSPFLFVGTVHGYCLRHIVRPFAAGAGIALPAPMRVASDSERAACGLAALTRVISADESWGGFGGWGQWVERYRKSRGRAIEGLDDRVVELAEQYEVELRRAGLIDYDDITNLSAQIIAENEWVRRCIAAKHPVVAIDEYQDLGVALHDIVAMLCDQGIRVFAVGDPDQCIYEQLQEARPELLEEFAGRDDVERVPLRLNYRAGSTLVRIAAAALGGDRGQQAFRGDAGRVHPHPIAAAAKQWKPRRQAHAGYIVSELLTALIDAEPDLQLGTIGILVQDRNMAEALAVELGAAGHSYVRLDSGVPYERTPLIVWTADAIRWCIGGWRTQAPRMGELLRDWTALDRTGERSRDLVAAWPIVVRFLWARRDEDMLLGQWLDQFAAEVKGQTHLDKELVGREIEALAALRTACAPDELHSDTRISEFAIKRGPPTHPTIVTLHSAKGLEFPTVIMPLLDEGVLPRFNIDAETAGWREQRRLFYVGVTRAMDDLHLVYSREHGPSPFLRDLLAALDE